MKFALGIPNCHGDFADVRLVAEVAHEAEVAGWNGFFVWDHISDRWGDEVSDPWVMLTAMAMRTEHITLGTMVTPIPRRRPWKLSREVVTLDQLSGGRMVLGVGIGVEKEYTAYNESGDSKRHGAMLDEALEVLTRLWSGETISYEGQYYQLQDVRYLPRPVQQPRIPIWVGAFWPHKKPMRRAAQWDGIFPLEVGQGLTGQMSPATIRECLNFIRSQQSPERAAQPYELVHRGQLAGQDAGADLALVEEYAAAGATWWLENIFWERGSLEEQRAYIRKGPPRLK